MLSSEARIAGGIACPVCGKYAVKEPGGTRGITCGHLLTFDSILPKTSTGHDRQNRLRQQALDMAFAHPGRGGQIPLLLLERLEGRPDDVPRGA